MAPRTNSQTPATGSAMLETSGESSIDPICHILRIILFSFLWSTRLCLKLPVFTLPSPMAAFTLNLLTYFLVVSSFVYDVIVDPPCIGSTQDPTIGAIRPVVFMSGPINGHYIFKGLSSGFIFVLGGVRIIMLDLALDNNLSKSINASYATAGISSVVIAYVMSMLFIHIKIPSYLH